MFFKPLSPGKHVLHVHTEAPALGLVTDNTLHLTIVKAKKWGPGIGGGR